MNRVKYMYKSNDEDILMICNICKTDFEVYNYDGEYQNYVKEWLALDVKCQKCNCNTCEKCQRTCYQCLNEGEDCSVLCLTCMNDIDKNLFKKVKCELHGRWYMCKIHINDSCHECEANRNYCLKQQIY